MGNRIQHIKSFNYVSTDLQKLRDEIHRAIDLRIDQFLQNSRAVEILPTNNDKITWLKSEEALFIFYELLILHKYIECNFTFFQSHFMGTEPTPDKIIFLKPTNQLPHIMNHMEEDGFIAKCNQPHIRLAQHFLSHTGAPISNNVLRSSLDKKLGKKAKKFIEENILDKLQIH